MKPLIRARRAAHMAALKRKREIAMTEILPEACIARTSWLFGTGGRCFPETILKLAADRSVIDVVNDQRGSPTYAPDLARAIQQLCHKNAEGIVHVTNRGECTWFDFAREIVARAGLPTEVRPTTSDKFIRPAERPQYSVLSPRSLELYGITTSIMARCFSRYMSEAKNESQRGGKQVSQQLQAKLESMTRLWLALILAAPKWLLDW